MIFKQLASTILQCIFPPCGRVWCFVTGRIRLDCQVHPSHLQAQILGDQKVQKDGHIPFLAQLPCKGLQTQVRVLVERQGVDEAAHVLVDQSALAVPVDLVVSAAAAIVRQLSV